MYASILREGERPTTVLSHTPSASIACPDNAFEASLQDGKLRGLYDYWRAKSGALRMPYRCAIDPVEIPAYLSELFLVEIHQPLRFRYRLVGTAICDRWGQSFTGKWLDELDLKDARLAKLAQYSSVAETGHPRCDDMDIETNHGRYLSYRRILLPLASDSDVPSMLMGMQVSRSVRVT